jgi:hypothetical protein
MRLTLPISLLLVLALLPPIGANEGAHPAQPASAVVAAGTSGAVLVWSPGTEIADEYNVYGLSDGGALLLDSVPADQRLAEVPAGFNGYAVSGVKDDVETALTEAVGVCVHVGHTPPSVRVGCLVSIGPLP